MLAEGRIGMLAEDAGDERMLSVTLYSKVGGECEGPSE